MSVLIGASVNPDTVVKCNKEKLAMDILLSYILLVAWISRPGGLTLMNFLTSGGKIFQCFGLIIHVLCLNVLGWWLLLRFLSFE